MDDVVGEVVFTVGDENLRAGETIGAVRSTLGLGAQGANVGAGLRLSELHGAHPFAADQLAKIFLLQL